MIYAWTVEDHLTTVEIAKRLNDLGIPTRYKKDGRKINHKGKRAEEFTAGIWRAGRVLNMIRNTAYMGVWEWGKRSKKRKPEDRLSGYSPAIVSREEFNKAFEVLQSHRIIPKNDASRRYLLRGLVKCELCGLTFSGVYSRVGKHKEHEKRYYVCNGRHSYIKLGKPKCLSVGINAGEIEKAVWEDVKFYCQNPEVVISQLKEEFATKTENIFPKIEDIERQIQELNRQRENLIALSIKSKELDVETLDRFLAENSSTINRLNNYKQELEKQRINQRQLEDELSYAATRLENLGKNIENASFDERYKVISELIKSITVNKMVIDGKEKPIVTITYRFNEPKSSYTIPTVV